MCIHAVTICSKVEFSNISILNNFFTIDRMPVILGDKESTDTWLNDSSSSNFDKLLQPYEGPDLVSNS